MVKVRDLVWFRSLKNLTYSGPTLISNRTGLKRGPGTFYPATGTNRVSPTSIGCIEQHEHASAISVSEKCIASMPVFPDNLWFDRDFSRVPRLDLELFRGSHGRDDLTLLR